MDRRQYKAIEKYASEYHDDALGVFGDLHPLSDPVGRYWEELHDLLCLEDISPSDWPLEES